MSKSGTPETPQPATPDRPNVETTMETLLASGGWAEAGGQEKDH